MRIENLTDEQRARFPEFIDRWTKIGLCTAPADRAEAEKGVIEAYRIAGLPAPKIVWCGSPLSAGMTRAIILDKRMIAHIGKAVRASVWASVRASVWASVGDSVGDSVWDSVGDSVGDSGYGQHDANWLGFYEYFREVCGLTEQTEKLSGLSAIAKSAGWFLPHEKICWLSERHHVLSRDERGRLHAVGGPAVAYPDGWAIYAVHGTRVPAWVVERPYDITVEKIDAETNAEVARVMMELFPGGWDAYMTAAGAKCIDRASERHPLIGVRGAELYRRARKEGDPILAVRVINSTPEPDGSVKRYMLRVHPQCRPMMRRGNDVEFGAPQELTALNAIASTFGMTGAAYARQMIAES